jgi:flagellar biogenesis protein FliO
MLLAAKSLTEIVKDLPPDKAKELRALWAAAAGLLILAVALVAIAWWTVHRIRRRMRTRLGSSRPIHDAWYQKPPPGETASDEDEPRS